MSNSQPERLTTDDFPLTVAHARVLLEEAVMGMAAINSRIADLSAMADSLSHPQTITLDRLYGQVRDFRPALISEWGDLAAQLDPDAPWDMRIEVMDFHAHHHEYLCALDTLSHLLSTPR